MSYQSEMKQMGIGCVFVIVLKTGVALDEDSSVAAVAGQPRFKATKLMVSSLVEISILPGKCKYFRSMIIKQVYNRQVDKRIGKFNGKKNTKLARNAVHHHHHDFV